VPTEHRSGAILWKQATDLAPRPLILGQFFCVGTADLVTVPIFLAIQALYPRHGIAYLRSRQAIKRACRLHSSVLANRRQAAPIRGRRSG
jgi:hypothetical protein